MIHAQQGTRAVSDVVASLLMVAIVFLVTVTVGNFVVGQYSESNGPVPATVDFDGNQDATVSVEWTGKEAAEQIVVDNGTTTRTLDTVGQTDRIWFGPTGQDINVFAQAPPERETLITQFDAPEFTSAVYAQSATCDFESTCGGTVSLNGTEIFSDRGINILVFDNQGRFRSYAHYNTDSKNQYRPPAFNLDAQGRPDMNPEQNCNGCADERALDHIQTLPTDSYVLLVGHSQPGAVDASLEAEYERMGADFSGDDTLETNDSWILATEKTADANPDEYQAIFERHAPRGDQSETKSVTGYLYTPPTN